MSPIIATEIHFVNNCLIWSSRTKSKVSSSRFTQWNTSDVCFPRLQRRESLIVYILMFTKLFLSCPSISWCLPHLFSVKSLIYFAEDIQTNAWSALSIKCCWTRNDKEKLHKWLQLFWHFFQGFETDIKKKERGKTRGNIYQWHPFHKILHVVYWKFELNIAYMYSTFEYLNFYKKD